MEQNTNNQEMAYKPLDYKNNQPIVETMPSSTFCSNRWPSWVFPPRRRP